VCARDQTPSVLLGIHLRHTTHIDAVHALIRFGAGLRRLTYDAWGGRVHTPGVGSAWGSLSGGLHMLESLDRALRSGDPNSIHCKGQVQECAAVGRCQWDHAACALTPCRRWHSQAVAVAEAGRFFASAHQKAELASINTATFLIGRTHATQLATEQASAGRTKSSSRASDLRAHQRALKTPEHYSKPKQCSAVVLGPARAPTAPHRGTPLAFLARL